MNILLKYTLKSIGERKFRAFLIIFAISLSCGLFLASTRVSDSVSTIYLEKLKAAYGDLDLVIYSSRDSKSSYVSESAYEVAKDDIEAAVCFLSDSGTYSLGEKDKSWNISISGYRIDEYLKINKLKILEGDVSAFDGNQIILSQRAASDMGLKVGDTFDMTISEAKRKVTLCAVVAREGMFANEKDGFVGMMPFDTLSRYKRTSGKADEIYLIAKPGIPLETIQNKIKENNFNYEVEELFNEQTLKQELSSLTLPFLMMTSMVVFMSAFVIYSCFKVIMLEKLPVVGVFRSVGADKRMINKVLLLEALVYGLIGGICACLLGIGCLYAFEHIILNLMEESASIKLEIPLTSYIMTIIAGVVMAVFSTAFPILSVSKISLKDIILGSRPYKKNKNLKHFIIGMIFIVLGFAMTTLMNEDTALLIIIVCFFIIIVGVIYALPIIVLGLSKVMGVVFSVIFGNTGELAVKNIKKNKSVLNSITLITIGMGILLTIGTITKCMQEDTLNRYKGINCEIMGHVWGVDNQKIKKLCKVNGVKRVIETMYDYRRIEAFDNDYLRVETITTTKLTPEVDFHIEGDEEALLSKLQTGRYLILNNFVKERYKLQEEDQITIDFDGKPRVYTIIGFMDTNYYSNIALASYTYYRQDCKANSFNWIYMSLEPEADAEEVIKDIEEHLQGIYTYLMTVEGAINEELEANSMIMNLIKLFGILSMVIGVVGVLNNLMISFIERRQNIAMLRAVGMSKSQVLMMILVEGLGSGVIGALGGIGTSMLCGKIFEIGVAAAGGTKINMNLTLDLCVLYLVIGMLITVVGSIIPAIGGSKLSIVDSIKYE